MNIAGFQPTTLSDYPGHVAAIIFTQGCNFRCPFCHNGDLLETRMGNEIDENGKRRFELVPKELVLAQLAKRSKQLTGVVMTGGEPTLQQGLLIWLQLIKKLGFQVKLDTNGSRPRVLKIAIKMNLVDFIAMDVKAPPEKYSQLAGVHVDMPAIEQSISIIAKSGLPHEFRTTHVTPLLTEEDVHKIRNRLPSNSPFRVQPFIRENALDTELREPIQE